MAKIYFPTFDRDVKINNGKELQLKEGTSKKLSDCEIGEIIYLPETNNNVKAFEQYILCEKTNDYVVLVRKVATAQGYPTDWQTWCSTTYIDRFSVEVKNHLTTKTIDYGAKNSYLLYPDEANSYFLTDGARIAYNSSGTAVKWWLRNIISGKYYGYVNTSGQVSNSTTNNSNYYRPAIVFLPNTPLNSSNQFIDEVTYTDTIDTIKFGDDLYRIKDVNAEMSSNKVTALSNTSTDTQYPSAKCVYDLIGDVEQILADLIGGNS